MRIYLTNEVAGVGSSQGSYASIYLFEHEKEPCLAVPIYSK